MIWLSVNLDFFTQNFLLRKFYFSALRLIGGITGPFVLGLGLLFQSPRSGRCGRRFCWILDEFTCFGRVRLYEAGLKGLGVGTLEFGFVADSDDDFSSEMSFVHMQQLALAWLSVLVLSCS
ncbi:hypothetical protein [Rhodoferax aquaticus]|uniref:hypothetical protein n=1 Tax=Rhodoferax aquaticus TaxID=2527691 RepID=UPI00143D7A7F|nr:hypothetical protein [Rhodoferax aquaticus]